MRKRNVRFQVRLDKKEADAFSKKVKRSGISCEAYLRHLINGLVPNDLPPPDYHLLTRELYGIGSRMNQIAIKAHTAVCFFVACRWRGSRCLLSAERIPRNGNSILGMYPRCCPVRRVRIYQVQRYDSGTAFIGLAAV